MENTTHIRAFSNRTAELTQSGIRAASVRCTQMNGINLGQGICDIPVHDAIKHEASDAIFADKNIYTAHEGLLELHEQLAVKIQNFNHSYGKLKSCFLQYTL